ncbi:MAG TPA: phosphoribosyltransferase [Pseudomonadota bacterium]|nr:phosphoribosyltransferase [Pseudomonadota bacterium]
MSAAYKNRTEAGRDLAGRLAAYKDRSDVLVLALPRGGVPVAYEVALALHAPLDVFLVRKLGVPGHEELAMGAIASDGTLAVNTEVVDALCIPEETLSRCIRSEQVELARRDKLYRGQRPPPVVQGRTVLIVDDGLATGSTMQAALAALRQRQPGRLVVAVPIAAAATAAALRSIADEVICLRTPEPFYSVSQGYKDFSQTTDQEVRSLLNLAMTSSIAAEPRREAPPPTL